VLNLHHLRLFRAVARDGTLTGAARVLNISQSAVSTQVRALEAALGQDLFERRGRALVLTEAGRIALDHAEEIFRTADDLSASLRRAETSRKALRIGALATLSRNFQMAFLAPLLGRSDVEVVLRSGGQEDLPARDAASPYLVHRLDDQPVSLVGTPGRVPRGTGTLPELLATHPLILPTPETSLRAGFDALLDRLDVAARIAAEADDMAMLRLLARADAGLAVLPPIVVQDELEAGQLVEVARLEGIEEVFCAVTMRRRFPNPLLAEVLAPVEAAP